jgi:hypothetical protein
MIEEINLPGIQSLNVIVKGGTWRRGADRNIHSTLVKVGAPSVGVSVISCVSWICVMREIVEQRDHAREKI